MTAYTQFILQLCLFISATVSLICCIVVVVIHVKHTRSSIKKEPFSFMFALLSANIVSMLSLVMNFASCNLLERYFYLAFNQSALCLLAILIFVEFYILTIPIKEFGQGLNTSSSAFLLSSFLTPLVVGLPAFIIGATEISHDSYNGEYCFDSLHSGIPSTLTLFIPTFCIFFAAIVFKVFIMKWMERFNEVLTEPIFLQFKQENILVMSYLGSILFPILIVELIYSFWEESILNYIYQMLLICLNLFGLLCCYLYGVNSTLISLFSWKLSFFIEITSDKLGTYSSSKTQQTKQISLNRTTSNKLSSYKSIMRNTNQTQGSSKEKRSSDYYQSFNGVHNY